VNIRLLILPFIMSLLIPLTLTLTLFGCSENVNSTQAKIKVDQSQGIAPLTVAFDSSHSAVDPKDSISSYLWYFGDETPMVETTTPTVTHTYTTGGDFFASVKLKMSNGKSYTSPSILISVTPNGIGKITLGEPTYSGSGCPDGTLSATLSPDKKTLSVLFDQMVAHSGTPSLLTIDQQQCSLAIPVIVPNGYSVSIYKFDYRGFSEIPTNGEGYINVEYFFAGLTGMVFEKTLVGPLSEEFFFSNNITSPETIVWSKCGEEVILRSSISINTKTNEALDPTMVTIDSLDATAALDYHLEFEECL
jgi:hypothetical protein